MLDAETQRWLRAFVDILLVDKGVVKPDQQMHMGTLISEDGDGSCTVQIEGVATDVPGVKKLAGSLSVPNATCLMIRIGTDWIIVGCIDTGLEWQSFIPLWTNVTLGTSPTNYGYFRQTGNRLEYKAGFILGTGGTVTGTIQLSSLTLPAVLASRHESGAAWANDSSAATRYAGAAVTSGLGDNILVFRLAGNATGTGWGSASPFTWAVSDELHIAGSVILA